MNLINDETNIIDIPISEIDDFPNHPYRVIYDEKMEELITSIEAHGLLQPVLVRPVDNGKYEMISGHRRKAACQILGYENLPCRVRKMTKEEATITMVESNCYREVILPSEKARAYKMRLDAIKSQGKRTDLTSAPTEQKLSRKELASSVGESQSQVQRYIRLNELIPDLLQLVDEGKMKLRPAVEISYMDEYVQADLADFIEYYDATPSHAQAIRMRKLYENSELTKSILDEIMSEDKPNQCEHISLPAESFERFLAKKKNRDDKINYLLKACECYENYLRRMRDRDER